MNHSIHSADRTTHLKVVIAALIAGILFAGFGMMARSGKTDDQMQAARVIKAGKPVMITNSNTSTVN